MGLCLWKKKGRGRQSIKGLSAWLAARSAFLRLLRSGWISSRRSFTLQSAP